MEVKTNTRSSWSLQFSLSKVYSPLPSLCHCTESIQQKHNYTDFLKLTRAVHQKGKCLYLHIIMVTVKIFMITVIGKEILKKRHEQIKDAIASGTVDETKAVGKSCAACGEL